MRIAIGSDHIGVPLKQEIIAHLNQKGHQVTDLGPDTQERCDYPVYGEKVARAIVNGEADCGVLICGTGIGISLAANKVRGIRAAVCSEPYSAMMAKSHNNAQIIAFGARVVGADVAKMIVDTYLETSYEGGRHQNRLDMIAAIEQKG